MLSILGTIQCHVNPVTLNSLLANYGLKAVDRGGSEFDVTSLTRHSNPALERDLFSLATQKMAAAFSDGALPSWRIVE